MAKDRLAGWRQWAGAAVLGAGVVFGGGCDAPASGSGAAATTDSDLATGRLQAENLELKMALVEAQAQQLPSVKVLRTATPPKIDGAADEATWAPAEEFRFSYNPWAATAGDRSEPATRVKVLYDDEFLYVLFRVEGEQWVASEKERDGRVYQDERVEVFLDADERDDLYHCVEVNPLGTVEDYGCAFYRGYQLDWSPPTLQAAGAAWVIDGKTVGYVVEVRVPWSAVTARKTEGGKVLPTREVPFRAKSGAVLGAGFYRIHIVPDGPNVKESYSLWRPPWSPFPDYHLTSTFGRMVLE